MVRSFLLSLTVFLLCAAGVSAQSTVLMGIVKDNETGETLIGATVKVMKGTQIIRGGVTNFDGEYRFTMDAGTYDVEVSYTGYAIVKTTGVQVLTGKINDFNINMSSSAVLKEAVITEYKVPLIRRDETSGGQTLTSETIKNLPTRSVNAIVATTAGTTSIDGGDVNIKGARANATNYYIDGIRVSGATVPVQDIEQLQVVTGGLGAEYGDVTGGVISVVTKGPASAYNGAVDVENSYGLDPYGWFLANANISGPLLKRKSTGASIIGFRLSGQYHTQKDNDPPALKVAHIKPGVRDNLFANPIARGPNGNEIPAAELLTNDSMDFTSYRQFEDRKDIDLTGKLDFRLSDQIDLSVTGTFKDTKDKFTPDGSGWTDRNWLALNSQNNPTQYDRRWRTIARFRHRLGGDSGSKENARKVSISNASYQLQFGFERFNRYNEDPRHKDRIFDYGYVGRYNFEYRPIGDLIIGQTATGEDTVYARHVDTREDFVGYTAGSINPGLANYNKFANPEVYESYIVRNGRQSDLFSDTWNDMHQNISQIYNRYSYSENDIITIAATSSFDLKLGNTGTHNIQFGLLNEQRTLRDYRVSPFAIWDLASQKANGTYIVGPDTTRIRGKYWDEFWSPIFGDSLYYFYNKTAPASALADQKFHLKVRENNGIPLDEYVNVHALTPEQMSLDMFGALELTNRDIVGYYGYDYLGNKLDRGVTFNDFFTATDKDGIRSFPVAPLQPLYQAAYVKDKFSFKDIIFSLGLRVERFDLNTKVLKDKYSRYEIMSAEEYYRTIPAPARPATIGDDFKVYVQSATDLQPRAFRDGDTWYNADGIQQTDGTAIYSTQRVVPLLKDTISGDNMLDTRYDPNTSFEDYKPQVNWMPRLAFSFPISDNANFFAHYDVLVQRPPGNWETTPLSYLYFDIPSRTPENNPNLKPERVVDYEVGFQQKLNNYSALKFSAYYKEFRDMIQLRLLQQVAEVGTYLTFDNLDFGTVKGFTLGYDLRRLQNVELKLAYTLQFADGTGSSSESQRDLSRFGTIRTLFPLDFDERHNIAAIIDYRFASGKAYNGPRLAGKDILANFGVNMQVSAASGRPYTARDLSTRFGADGISGSLNGARLPWRTNLDVRVDKTFELTKAGKSGLSLNVYFRVANLLDARNIVGVYGATGSPINDGYLATQQGQSILNGTGTLRESYLASYSWLQLNPNNYTQPRRMYVGASLNF